MEVLLRIYGEELAVELTTYLSLIISKSYAPSLYCCVFLCTAQQMGAFGF